MSEIKIEEVPEVPEPSRRVKVKQFVKKNQIPIACFVTGSFVFSVTAARLGMEIDRRDLDLRRLRGEFEELYEQASLQGEFIDHKKLRDKYFEFVKAQYPELEA